ncbi:MAG: BrnA antitoxin family protein [Desulfurellaceae bacterium]|nr:BrnA antitoxin family protein [Desulfurellaceae bacterium]
MSKSSSSTTSKTDWPRLKAMPEQDIRLTDEHPAAEVDHIVRGIARKGLRPVPPKALISLRVDADVLAWFKAQGAGYQTRMSAVLRAFKEASG